MTAARLSTRRQLELLNELQQLADRRAADEAAIALRLRDANFAASEAFETAAYQLAKTHSERQRELETGLAETKRRTVAACEADRINAQKLLAEEIEKLNVAESDAIAAAKRKAQNAQFEAMSVYDAAKDKPELMWSKASKLVAHQRQQLNGLQRDAEALLGMRRIKRPELEPLEVEAAPAEWEATPDEPSAAESSDAAAAPPLNTAAERLRTMLPKLREQVLAMQNQRLPSLFLEGGGPWGWLVGAAAFGAVAAALIGTSFTAAGVGAGVALVAAAAALWAWLLPRSRRQSLGAYTDIAREIVAALRLADQSLVDAKAAATAEATAIVDRRDRDLKAADVERDRRVQVAQSQRAAQVARLEQATTQQLEALDLMRDEQLAAAEAKYPPLIEANAAEWKLAERTNNQEYERRRTETQQSHAAEFAAFAEEWHKGFAQIAAELHAIADRAHDVCPDWNEIRWNDWPRPATLPEGISLGGYDLPLTAVKNGVPADPRLAPAESELPLTATLSWDEQPRLVVTAEGDGRRPAVDVLQLAMLRTLCAMPAGLLRLTLIDPAGLGESFGPFMHLADYDEQLAPKQVLTESKRIEERLGLVTAHMEKVLQQRLRNEFATLAEYNAQAGEVAEPYHVVVVANFPAGFTEIAARRLLAIAEAGPRCGVYILMSVDRTLRLPYEIKLEPFLNSAMHLDWNENQFTWQYPLFEKLALKLDSLPAQDRLTEVLRRAAQESKAASRVEVGFHWVAPKPEGVWTENSARELVVPIGRAGARELESLRLGLGTSQHALISGKTGSGKSTLLHALVTNAALRYAPDQVEFYLVDFKKGVEFKTYASEHLPHARVIAIESEREFGISVLERLDAELRRRGELYRDAGVQDLAGFRAARPNLPMPRTLLIIDEFQELFVADDQLAQQAGLLLDRLVRQGRAFGVHVILGSQTLAGAYSLARSTLGQMAVRIALQCSDADAHLILSDENPAARLLTRPGDAIYNDENGLASGNHPFQVAWLPDAQRRDYLRTLRDRPVSQPAQHEPAIVFEGNVPADVRTNAPLAAALAGRGDVAEPTLWLGSAVKIEPPTNLVLRRQSGQNVVILGSEESSAVGILSTAVAAILAEQADRGVQITVLNGARPESEYHAAWPQIAAALQTPALHAPAGGDAALKIIAPRDTAASVTELADEVARRAASGEESPAPRYLIVHDVSQLRELRLTEDDFSFSSAKKPASADKRFREILRDGPAVGVHILMWCDSYNALSRVIDRIAMREFDYRIALPISAGDSTSFIETPAAGRLGEHRALLYRDDLGTLTKFRPYSAPTAERLAWLAKAAGAVVA